MKVNRKFALVLPILTALLLSHSSAKPVTESGQTMKPEGRANSWASDASKVLPGVQVWLAAVPKEDGKVHTDGSARSWAS